MKTIEEILELIQDIAEQQDYLMRTEPGVQPSFANDKTLWYKHFRSKIAAIRQVGKIQGISFDFEGFSLAIQQKRSESNLTLRELARDIVVSASSIGRLENGHLPDLLTYAKLCMWLGVSTDKFFK